MMAGFVGIGATVIHLAQRATGECLFPCAHVMTRDR